VWRGGGICREDDQGRPGGANQGWASLLESGINGEKRDSWMSSGPSCCRHPPGVRFPWKLVIREFWYFQLLAGHADRGLGSAVPCDPCGEMEPQGASTIEACGGGEGRGRTAWCSRWRGWGVGAGRPFCLL
jgi:hypothetical protein